MSHDDEIYQEAKKRVKAKKGFFSHLTAFIATGFFFFAMNMFTSPGDIWFVFPMLPWSIGLIIHGVSVFGLGNYYRTDKAWELEQIEKEAERIRNKAGYASGLPDPRERRKGELDMDGHLELKEIRKQYDDRDLV